MWMPEASSPAMTQGMLCPSQRRMPNIGSLLAESAASLVFLARLPINVAVSLPVLIHMKRCSVVTRGHALMKTCGADLVSLDDYFVSLFKANDLFWMALNIVADSFGPGAPQTFVKGLAMAGNNDGWKAPVMPGPAAAFATVSRVEAAYGAMTATSATIAMPKPIVFCNTAPSPMSSGT